MAFIPLRNFGKYGVVHDTQNSALPIGTWSDALNMRFSGIEMEKMLEPTLFASFAVDEPAGPGYACDALDDSILALEPLTYWDMDDPLFYGTSGVLGGAPDLVGTVTNAELEFLNADSQWDRAAAPLLADSCPGRTAIEYSTANTSQAFRLGRVQNTVSPGTGWLQSSGYTAGFLFSGDFNWIDNWVRVGIGEVSSTITVRAKNDGEVYVNFYHVNDGTGGVGQRETSSFTPTGSDFIIWSMTSDASSTTFKVWMNFQLVIDRTFNQPIVNDAWPQGVGWNVADIGNLVGTFKIGAGFTMNRLITSEEVSDLSLGYDRNFTTYTPPPAVTSLGTPKWMQLWADGFSSYIAVVIERDEEDYLYWLDRRSDIDEGTWVQVGGPYSSAGQWQSFAWGDTCIFNNGRNSPQMWDGESLEFVDLPNWGVISSAADITANRAPSRDTQAACTCLVPFKNHLVACGVTERGTYYPNKVWWSDTITFATYKTGAAGGPPSWDYESPSTNSGQSEVGLGDGKIRTAAPLNEALIIYCDSSATAMQLVGGRQIMRFLRLFNKGAASLHTVVEFQSSHYVVARDQIYIHDGSIPRLIAKDRVEDEFFERIGKGGRYGDGTVDWTKIQVVKNPDRKEIMICFDSEPGYGSNLALQTTPAVCLPYSCSAIEDTVLAGEHNLWPLTDPTFTVDYPSDGVLTKLGAGFPDLLIQGEYWGTANGFFEPGDRPYKGTPLFGITNCDPDPQYCIFFDRPNTGAWIANAQGYNPDGVQHCVLARADSSANEYQFGQRRRYNWTSSPGGQPNQTYIDFTVNLNTTNVKVLGGVPGGDRTYDITSLNVQDGDAVYLVYTSTIQLTGVVLVTGAIYRQNYTYTFTLDVIHQNGKLSFSDAVSSSVSNMTGSGMTLTLDDHTGLTVASLNQTLAYLSVGPAISIAELEAAFNRNFSNYQPPAWCEL